MWLPQLSIRRPVLTTTFGIALLLFGCISLTRLPVRELPNVDPPIVSVITVYPGASAEVMETEVSERLEEQLNSIEGIKTLTSESREQVSSITVEFNLSRPIDVAAQDVRDRVSRVRGALPDDIEEPVIAKQEADAQPILWIALSSTKQSTLELSTFAEDQLKPRLETVTGVSSVRFGGQKRFAIRLWLDSERMAARGVTVSDVEQALKSQNVELPSGRVEGHQRELAIEMDGAMRTPEEFNRMVIKNDGENFVRLQDVGEAKVGAEDERSLARFNGSPAVGLGIVKQSNANTISVAHGIKEELKRLEALFPDGMEASVPYDESVYVEKSIHEVWVTLGITFLLVVVTIFVFLRNVRSTLIPSLAIPLSVASTFTILQAFGYSINLLTMLGLVLVIGIVVDDAIVVLENIYRHIEAGERPMQAAMKAMDEIAFAILAITASLVVVFLPLLFQTSLTGRLLIEFAVAVAGSVVISAIVALTITPMISARILKPVEIHHGFFLWFEKMFNRLTRRYLLILDWSLAHRVKMGILFVVIILLTGRLYSILDKEFLPEEDKGRLLSMVLAPQGATLEYTDRMMRKMEGIVSAVPEVAGYFTAIALNFGGPGTPSLGFMFMKFKEERDRSVQDVVAGPTGLGSRFFTEVQGALAFPIIPKAIGRSFNQPFQLVLQNPDLKELNRFATDFTNKLRGEGVLMNVRSTFDVTKPQMSVQIERDRASALGVSVRDVSRTLQVMFGGLNLSQLNLNGKQYQVMVQLDRENRMSPEDLDRIYVRSQLGNLVPLSQVVKQNVGSGPASIFHYNRMRSTTIEGTPMGIPLGTAMDRVEALLKQDIPPGFRYEWAGESSDLKKTGNEMGFILILAVVVIYLVLAAQFESWLHPLTVMLALPLALFGAFGLLWLLDMVNQFGTNFYGWAHYSPNPPKIAHILSSVVPRIPAMNLNVFSQVGLVLLVGLVTKNSILLVEFANQKMEQGSSALEAMREAGRVRLRPILMTSFALIIGILPIAIGFGAGAESRRPLGVTILGGMLTSTFLTLVVIPVIYTVFQDLSNRFHSKEKRLHKGENK